jgi:hypothetical protein
MKLTIRRDYESIFEFEKMRTYPPSSKNIGKDPFG